METTINFIETCSEEDLLKVRMALLKRYVALDKEKILTKEKINNIS